LRKISLSQKGLWTFVAPSPKTVSFSPPRPLSPPGPHPGIGVSPRIAAKLVPVPAKDCQTSICGIFVGFSRLFLDLLPARRLKIVRRWFPLVKSKCFACFGALDRFRYRFWPASVSYVVFLTPKKHCMQNTFAYFKTQTCGI